MPVASGQADGDAPAEVAAVQHALQVAGVVVAGAASPRVFARAIGAAYVRDGIPARDVVARRGAVELSFALPCASDLVLLELPALPGTYRVGGMTLGGHRVVDLARRVIAANGPHAPCDGGTGVRYGAPGVVPWIELDLRGLVADHPTGALLSLQCLREEHGQASEDLLAALVARVHELERLVGDARRDTLAREDVGALDRARVLALSRDVDARLADQSRALSAHAETSGQRLGGLEDVVSRVLAQLSRLQEDLAHRDDGIAARHADAERRHEAWAQTASAWASSSDARWSALEGRLASLDAGVDATRRGIEHVFWRRWLRRLKGVAS